MKKLAVLLCLLAQPLAAVTFTVINTDDSGAGSLRQAILDANAAPGLDTIAFDIPGAGVHTISPATALPFITDPVVIDGYTQPGASPNTDPEGFNGTLLIELSGASSAPMNGLGISAGGSTVRGLVINGFKGLSTDSGNAILLNTFGGNHIEGNFFGTDAGGTIAQGNEDDAIIVGSDGNFIGGPTPAARNVISASGRVSLFIVTSGNVIQGNFIGTQKDGLSPLGNQSAIAFVGAGFADNNTIGGTAAGEANVIAFNDFWGVLAEFSSHTGNVIRGNSIHDNGLLGIGLGGGPHFNDALDADDGPNHLQNFPIVREVEHLGPQGNGSTRIAGKFNSLPSTTFDLDFYANPACSNFPREFIEGAAWLGTSQVTTDGNGNATFDETLDVATEAGARISVTATDPDDNTSEFSQRIIFSINPPSGPGTGGSGFSISGTDFADPTTVTVGGVAATGVTFVNDHQLTATMPAFLPGTSQDVVVTTPDGTTGTLTKGWVADFLDVPGGHQFYSFVTTLVSNGITAGVGGGNYGVDQGTKRQQMAVFLLKAKNGLCYVPPTCTGTFPDVVCPSTFADWIEDLAAQGITTGCGGGLFCPNNLVTRRQMAVFLLKTKYGSSYVPPACTGVFDDVACPGAPAVDFIERLAAEQITGGCSVSPPLYCPDNSANRGQMATFIVKTFGLQ